MNYNKVGFIGLGLIGGSIAKKMKNNHPEVSIIATAGHLDTLEKAHQLGLIENKTMLPLDAFKDCDLIFLCAPVQKNIEYLKELANIISTNTFITDVGSTKAQIHEVASSLGLNAQFIGGHPMTGSEKTGIQNADEYLLENAYYIITPTKDTPEQTIDDFYQLVKELGSIPLVMNYEEHDYATASISHLPHMIAFALVNLIKKSDDPKETMKTIAAGGFRDITRIASSSPVMWEHICLSNQRQLLSLIDNYKKEIQLVEEMIQEKDSQGLLSYFQSAKDYRDSLSIPNKNATVFELYLDLIDEAGGIATIATILAKSNISIKNIGIINNREFEEGVLRIEFYDADALAHAISLLEQGEYKLYIR